MVEKTFTERAIEILRRQEQPKKTSDERAKELLIKYNRLEKVTPHYHKRRKLLLKGNTLYVSIPKDICEQLYLYRGQNVFVNVNEGKIIVIV